MNTEKNHPCGGPLAPIEKVEKAVIYSRMARSEPCPDMVAMPRSLDEMQTECATATNTLVQNDTTTKTRILAAAKKLNYTTNFSARNLKMAKTLTIGLLLPDLTNPVNDLVAHGVQERAAELGYGVVIANHSDIGGDKTISQMLTQGHVDGIIAFVHSVKDSFLENFSLFGKIIAFIFIFFYLIRNFKPS